MCKTRMSEKGCKIKIYLIPSEMILFSIISFILFQRVIADKNTVPMFILDQDGALPQIIGNSNPFDKMSSSKFAEILHSTIKRSQGVIIFVEDQLNVEDISLKDKFGTPYIYLRQNVKDKTAKYIPAVVEPFKLLNQMFMPTHYNEFYIKSNGAKFELVEGNKYLYIYFQDALNETRIAALRRHDLIMKEVCAVVRHKKGRNVVAFYTGKVNPVEAEKLRFVPIKPIPIPKDSGVMVVSSGALFKFCGVSAITPMRRALFNQLPMIAEESWTRRSMSTKMAYTDFELEFNFSFKETEWIIDNVVLLEAGEEVGRTEMGVGAPWNMSYVCGEPLVIINSRDGSSVSIAQYQIQPREVNYRRPQKRTPKWGFPNKRSTKRHMSRRHGPSEIGYTYTYPPLKSERSMFFRDMSPVSPAVRREGDEEELPKGDGGGNPDREGGGNVSFGPKKNCGPYFSTAIISTLFVTFVCMLILMYGIVCLMAVRSNDRFDDPQSKPLVHVEN